MQLRGGNVQLLVIILACLYAMDDDHHSNVVVIAVAAVGVLLSMREAERRELERLRIDRVTG